MKRALPIVATVLACVAVVVAVITFISVSNRPQPAPAPVPAAAVAPAAPPDLIDVSIKAADLAHLYGAPAARTKAGARLEDPSVAAQLGLERGDVITAVGGIPVEEVRGLAYSVAGAADAHTQVWYVEIVRGGRPLVVRYHIDGDMHDELLLLIDPPAAPPPADPLLDTIVHVDSEHVTVPKATVDALLADPSLFAKSARVVASFKNGQPNGIKLYAIRPHSAIGRLGLMNGDTVVTINGALVDMNSLAQIVPTGDLHLELTRRGLPAELTITITP